MHTHSHMHSHRHIHVRAHTHTHTHTYTHTHTHTHTRTHAHKHTQMAPATAPPKLHYWKHFRGKGDPIRMTLHLKGIDWEEQDVDFADLKVDVCVVQAVLFKTVQ